jgi:hypothetical protein
MDREEIKLEFKNIISQLTALNITSADMSERVNKMDEKVNTLTADVSTIHYKLDKIFEHIMDTS